MELKTYPSELYHATAKRNLRHILLRGLLPKAPADMSDERAVYFFTSRAAPL